MKALLKKLAQLRNRKRKEAKKMIDSQRSFILFTFDTDKGFGILDNVEFEDHHPLMFYVGEYLQYTKDFHKEAFRRSVENAKLGKEKEGGNYIG